MLLDNVKAGCVVGPSVFPSLWLQLVGDGVGQVPHCLVECLGDRPWGVPP